MKIEKLTLSAVILLSLIYACSGAVPAEIVDSTDKDWIIAGSSDIATITVAVLDLDKNRVNNATVSTSVDDPDMGIVTQTSSTTNANGVIYLKFSPKIKSGDATIRIRVGNTAPDNPEVSHEFLINQKIDHATPHHFANIIYQNASPVNSKIDVIVQLKDRYGNVVDGKHSDITESETIRFIGSPDSGGFWNDTINLGYTCSSSIDSFGVAKVSYLLPKKSGINVIQVSAGPTVISNMTYIYIQGLALHPANDINGMIVPRVLFGNNEDTAMIYLTARDVYNNPIPNEKIIWWTDINETHEFTTNAFGEVSFIYGPKSAVASIRQFAGIDRTKILWEDSIQFLSPGMEDFLITATPQMMPSLDAKNSSNSTIRVALVDIYGNPVKQAEETISFSIVHAGADCDLNADPYLNEPFEVKTDANGIAEITYIPGNFSEDCIYSSGESIIFATWNSLSKMIKVQYKNYPHLKIEVDTPAECLNLGEESEITISISGSGWDMRKPIDVLLLEDRSETMLFGPEYGKGYEDRMWSAINASKVFIGCLTASPPYEGKDHIALASYGDNVSNPDITSIAQQYKLVADDNTNIDNFEIARYPGNGGGIYDFFTLHNALTEDYIDVIDNLENLTPFNDLRRHDSDKPEQQNAAPIRMGLYGSIGYLKGNASRDIKAIVGLMDTAWTWYGDPLAYQDGSTMKDPWGEASAGTSKWYAFEPVDGEPWSVDEHRTNWQNMSIYAKGNNITLWLVFYNAKMDENTYRTMQILSNSTGGKAYYASSPEELTKVFSQIAYELQRLSALNTTVSMDFSNISLNRSGITYINKSYEVFDYVHKEGCSTYITFNPATTQKPEGYSFPYTKNQTAEWYEGHLRFNAGNLSLGDTWSATFTLKAVSPGIIQLFDENSTVNYTDEYLKTHGGNTPEIQLVFPDQSICNAEEPNITVPLDNALDIIEKSIIFSNSSDVNNVLWRASYSGNQTIQQVSYYQLSVDGVSWTDWIKFGTNTTELDNFTNVTFSTNIDLQNLFGSIRFKIFAYEDITGGLTDIEISDPLSINSPKGQIKIE